MYFLETVIRAYVVDSYVGTILFDLSSSLSKSGALNVSGPPKLSMSVNTAASAQVLSPTAIAGTAESVDTESPPRDG